jgi:hypothetical protein
MADVPLAHALGQFGGDQTLSALLAGHPVDGMTRKFRRSHGSLPSGLLVFFKGKENTKNVTG